MISAYLTIKLADFSFPGVLDPVDFESLIRILEIRYA